MSSSTSIRSVLFKLFVYFVTIIVLVSLLAISPLLLPVYIYRWLLSKSIKIFRSDLSKILATRSQIFATDDIYTKPKNNLVVQLRFENQLKPIQNERAFFLNHLILLKDAAGELKRPEFQQYITSWFGFYFWKWDPHFKIENHIFDYEGQFASDSYEEQVFYNIGIDMLSQPFKKKQSPWEVIIFRNCKSEKYPKPFSGMIIRIHHSMADGFSILKFTSEFISSEGSLQPLQAVWPKKPKFTICQNICNSLSFILRAPFEVFECFLELFDDNNEWHIPQQKLSRVFQGFHTSVPVNFVKEIKNLHSVTFTATVLAGLCGAIRTFMHQHGIKYSKSYIVSLAALPAFGHPDRLRNYMTFSFMKLPVGTADPVERLHMIDKNLERIRTSTLPIFFLHLTPFIGGLFPFLTKFLSRQLLATVLVGNFPGPQHLVIYNNGQNRVLDILVGGGLLYGNIGLGLSACSYNGTLRAGVLIDENLLPVNIPVKDLVDNLVVELDLLKLLGTV